MSMKVKLLRRLRKKAKARTWLKYSNGHYSAYKKLRSGLVTSSFGIIKLARAIRELNTYRRELILDLVEDLREKKINKEIRKL